ncbi:unnamed protein product [Brachionus calyciflorus]|uniref:Uncharacterized protein n=1 Tax=Brachionus calyciflorus TaxID=104777 RepID=A0A814CQ54_9BILA|nr:unnamed protein product [Brachionus calyciflorus]
MNNFEDTYNLFLLAFAAEIHQENGNQKMDQDLINLKNEKEQISKLISLTETGAVLLSNWQSSRKRTNGERSVSYGKRIISNCERTVSKRMCEIETLKDQIEKFTNPTSIKSKEDIEPHFKGLNQEKKLVELKSTYENLLFRLRLLKNELNSIV